MVPDHIDPWPRDEGDELLHQLQRRHHDVGGAVAPWCLESERHPPIVSELETIIAGGGPSQVATQTLEALAVALLDLAAGMHVEAVCARSGLDRSGKNGTAAEHQNPTAPTVAQSQSAPDGCRIDVGEQGSALG
jgi:hypothetical protein